MKYAVNYWYYLSSTDKTMLFANKKLAMKFIKDLRVLGGRCNLYKLVEV